MQEGFSSIKKKQKKTYIYTQQYIKSIRFGNLKENLPKHGSELFRDALEQFLNGSGITNKGCGHFESTRRNVTNCSFDIIGDPFNKVGRILILNIEHLLIHFFHRHASTENSSNGQISMDEIFFLNFYFSNSKIEWKT